jgi:hypothetical protein
VNGAIRVVLEGVLRRWNTYLSEKAKDAIVEEIARIIERRERPLRERIIQLEKEAREHR